jgi:NADH dehydrogenase
MAETTAARSGKERKRVVILGGGFGGINAALNLAKLPVDVTMVDRKNYHHFQPLL